MISLFQMTSKYAIVLKYCLVVPKCRKVGLCFVEKMQVLDKLHSGISCRAVGCDLSVHISTVLLNKMSLNRNT